MNKKSSNHSQNSLGTWLAVSANLLLAVALAGICFAVTQWDDHRKKTVMQQLNDSQPSAEQTKAAEGCERVVKLLKELPDTASRVREVTARIDEERELLEKTGPTMRKIRNYRLSFALADLKKARTGLEQRLARFNEVVTIPPSTNPESLRDLQPRQIVYGPGKNLQQAVDRYINEVERNLNTKP